MTSGQAQSLYLAAVIALLSGCGVMEDESLGSRGSASIPKVTAPVGTVSGASVRAQSSALLFKTPGACAGCGPDATMAFNMASNYITIGKVADHYSCMVQAFLNEKSIPGDGTERVLVGPENEFKLKISARLDGERVSSFKIFICPNSSATENDNFVSGTTDSNGTTTILNKTKDSTARNMLTVTGTFLNGVWSNKTVTMSYAMSGGNGLFELAQGANNMTLKGVLNFGAPNYLYSKFKILGENAETYALDEGSAKTCSDPNGAGEVTSHWGSDGTVSGTPSMYASDISSGTYLPASSFTGDMTTSEQWDCQIGSTPTVEYALGSEGFAEMMSCEGRDPATGNPY